MLVSCLFLLLLLLTFCVLEPFHSVVFSFKFSVDDADVKLDSFFTFLLMVHVHFVSYSCLFSGVGEYVDVPNIHSTDLLSEDSGHQETIALSGGSGLGLAPEASTSVNGSNEALHSLPHRKRKKTPTPNINTNTNTHSSHRTSTSTTASSASATASARDISTPAFSLASNAVVVNIATPQAIAEAVDFLIRNCSARSAIAAGGRDTVLAYFTVERQMDQYSELYEDLTRERL